MGSGGEQEDTTRATEECTPRPDEDRAPSLFEGTRRFSPTSLPRGPRSARVP